MEVLPLYIHCFILQRLYGWWRVEEARRESEGNGRDKADGDGGREGLDVIEVKRGSGSLWMDRKWRVTGRYWKGGRGRGRYLRGAERERWIYIGREGKRRGRGEDKWCKR